MGPLVRSWSDQSTYTGAKPSTADTKTIHVIPAVAKTAISPIRPYREAAVIERIRHTPRWRPPRGARARRPVPARGPSIRGMSSPVRVQRQAIVCMRSDAMVLLAALPVGIDVNHHAAQVRQVVEQLVPDIAGNVMSLRHRQAGRHRDADVGVHPVADPPRAHVRDLLDPGDVLSGVSDLVQRLGLHA